MSEEHAESFANKGLHCLVQALSGNRCLKVEKEGSMGLEDECAHEYAVGFEVLLPVHISRQLSEREWRIS